MKVKSSPRRLGDLFRVGREVTIGDDLGSITVWMQKMNPMEQEKAVRKAQAVRARFIAQADPEDELTLSIVSDAYEMDFDGLLNYIVMDEISSKFSVIDARVAEENDWNENDYLTGLLDSWNGDPADETVIPLSEVYAKRDEDEMDPARVKEAERVWDELQRYNEQVNEAVEEERAALSDQYAALEHERLIQIVREKLIKTHADIIWAVDYRKNQLMYAIRENENRDQYYFSSREEIDSLPEQVISALYDAFNQLSVGGEEGKDSQEVADSSPSSEPQKIVEE